MRALCSGCIILFPEKSSDLKEVLQPAAGKYFKSLKSCEQYVPIKGDMFIKVIQFLRDLGIIEKCEEEG